MARDRANGCPICGRTYSRKEHLNRHLVTHTKKRPFVCGNCQLTFNRKDVLDRHFAICQESADSSTPSTAAVSSCVPPSPVSQLLHFEQKMLAKVIQNDFPDSLDLFIRVTTTHGLAGSFDPDLSPRLGKGPIPTNFFGSFVEEAVADGPLRFSSSMLDIPADLQCMDWTDGYCITTDDIDWLREPAELPPEPRVEEDSNISPKVGDETPSATDPLLIVSGEIVERLRDAVLHKARNSYISLQWSPALEEQCFEFFSPDKLRHFIDLYWLTWYIHWPVIHRSTFLITSTPCTLLAAMVLIGASYSSDPTDRTFAWTLGDSVEEVVFTDEYFGDTVAYSVLNAACLERRLRSLQAAHAMCLYQAWEGHDVGKRRARRHRFGQVVAMAREIGFVHASHGDLTSLTEHSFDWKDFILKEELIRTLNYMVVLDCGFIIMNNTPPRVFVPELQADLACPEACFQATTASECFSYLKAWLSHPSAEGGRMSILTAVEQLSCRDMGWEKLRTFTHLGFLNLGFLAMAIHSIIFQLRSSIGAQSQSIAMLKIWLQNWKAVWTLRKLRQTPEAFGTPLPPQDIPPNLEDRWRNAGFMKDAIQFWLLAHILLDEIQGDGAQARASFFSRKADDYDQTNMTHLKALLKSYKRQPDRF